MIRFKKQDDEKPVAAKPAPKAAAAETDKPKAKPAAAKTAAKRGKSSGDDSATLDFATPDADKD
ncbi:hypothetical protein DFR52_10166 [Hoeflea marina]|uniref:Uncharacterized protein n=1 Tax=Hoeflea marina TaxID=274592 RepID=A0A317PT22_9HYPH|nr:hypothetical protein [Hoeflea marina]PWW03386.1 hypothetical protein DFR52_10166 [Hoeflea marina]